MSAKERAAQLLCKWNNILVLSHASPDGDTLGSASGLIRALRNMGKQADFACADQPGQKYAYLFKGIENQGFIPEHVVSVDVADKHLLGEIKTRYPVINLSIDHHAKGQGFAEESWVDPTAAATALMVFELLLEMSAKIDEDTASCLYTGLSTDTGCFRYASADSRCYRAAAELMDMGAKAAAINRHMFETKTKASLEVEKQVFATMEFLHGDRIALAVMPKQLLTSTGADESELEGIPAMVRGIEGVLIGVTLKEKNNGDWKASVRAGNLVDASKICQGLGGGGHRGAAGCSLGTDFKKAREAIVQACCLYLDNMGDRP